MSDNIKQVASGLYRQFLIYDFTYTLSGVLILSSLGYAYCSSVQGLFCSFKHYVSANLLTFLLFLGLSYVVGIIIYDFIGNIVINLLDAILHLKNKKNYYIQYDKIVIKIGKKLRNNPNRENVVLNLDRHSHFEVVGLAFFSSSTTSLIAILLLPRFVFKTNPDDIQIVLILLSILTLVSMFNFIIAHVEFQRKIDLLSKFLDD
ncbi:MAG: hypothetical protein A2Y65_06305 [Deltaproteobacteria bacterium RBG_13_52_11]|nr:MAG: hypothetical protein A2Y65_06305 [Deltaproteobacteria bacterium RBG_13_52_11]